MSGAREGREALAPLVYWLLVLGGLLAAHRVLAHEPTVRALALWLGALLGTGVGQVLAWQRLRIRAFAAVLPVLLIALFELGAIGLWVGWTEGDLGLACMALAPATVCGYASMTERGALLAFWFPTSIWILGILDGKNDAGFGGAESWALLSVLAALFVVFLLVREARRLGLWQGHARPRLSVAGPQQVVRRSPARGVGQAAWLTATATATLVLTAWVAPHLLQQDRGQSPALAQVHPEQPTTGAGGAPCCPDESVAPGESTRVREYFPLLEAHDGLGAHPAGSPCEVCSAAAATGAGDSVQGVSGGGQEPQAPGASPEAPATGPGTAPVAPLQPTAQPPVTPGAPSPPPQAQSALPATPVHPLQPAPPAAPSPASAWVAVWPVAPALPAQPLQWLLALVASAIVVQLTLRPVRRLVALRHLRAPLWPEPVDQQISNLWHLALVGLRDGGWNVGAGDAPQQIAERVASPAVAACGQVLDRCRHGVRVDATDLAAMRDAAAAAYRTSRRRAGLAARAVSWLRWPLV